VEAGHVLGNVNCWVLLRRGNLLQTMRLQGPGRRIFQRGRNVSVRSEGGHLLADNLPVLPVGSLLTLV